MRACARLGLDERVPTLTRLCGEDLIDSPSFRRSSLVADCEDGVILMFTYLTCKENISSRSEP